jgi:hypothetical protein
VLNPAALEAHGAIGDSRAQTMSESKDPPRLPDIVDEAGPSPGWLPWLGIALLCVFAGVIAAQITLGKSDEDAAAAEDARDGAEAAAGSAAEPSAAAAEAEH